MPGIAKNSTVTFTSRMLIFVLEFFAAIILARALGPGGKGIYTLIVLVPLLMLKLGSAGIEASNVYFTGSRKYEIGDIVSNSLLSSVLFSSILIFLFLGVFHLDIFRNFLSSNQISPLCLWLVVLTVPFSLIFNFLINIFLGAEKINIYNKINILKSALQLVLIVFFLVILKKGLFGAVISYTLGAVASVLFVILSIKKFCRVTLSFNPGLLKDTIKYGLKAYFGNLSQFINYRLDIFLVAAFLAPVSVGFYSIAVGIAERLWILPGAIASVLFSKVSSLNDQEANSITPRIARHTFLIIFILSLVLALISRPLIKILFGAAFLPSVMPLVILLPGVIALGGCKILTADLAGRGKPQFGTYAAFVSLAVNIPLNLWLIPKWGVSGAAFASSTAYITSALIVMAAFVNISGTSWREILLLHGSDIQDYRELLIKIKKRNKYPAGFGF